MLSDWAHYEAQLVSRFGLVQIPNLFCSDYRIAFDDVRSYENASKRHRHPFVFRAKSTAEGGASSRVNTESRNAYGSTNAYRNPACQGDSMKLRSVFRVLMGNNLHIRGSAIDIRRWLVMFGLLLGFSAHSADIKIGESFAIDSKIMGEERTVLVYLPKGYAAVQSRFPVLYVTDGDAHGLSAASSVDFLSSTGSMPEMIVIGIANTDRMRDLPPSPSTDPRWPSTGGADRFLRFIEEELMPAVDKRYRTAPYKVFAGHSVGGLFAINVFLTHPNAFDAYIAASPSLFWDDRLLIKKAEARFVGNKAHGVLFMSMGGSDGDEEKMMREPFDAMKHILEKQVGPDFVFDTEIFADESHSSGVLRSFYRGMKKAFFDWPASPDLSFAQVLEHYAKLSKRLHYTVMSPEGAINRLGYTLASQQKFGEAIEVMNWYTKNYSTSANAYDSLAEVLEQAGKLVEAKVQSEKAVALALVNKSRNVGVMKANLERISGRLNKQ